jgi:peroxiredoxin
LPLLLTLDSVHLSTIYPMHKKIAQNIADNVLSLANGTVAPPFELPDSAGNNKSLHSFRGKYVYLHFANTETYTSQMEFELIRKLHERYKGVCIFLTVLTDSDKKKATSFMQGNKYEWNFVFAEINSEVISAYQVSSFPTYYLIDTYGNLMMSPAPSPAENFEQYFFKIVSGKEDLK